MATSRMASPAGANAASVRATSLLELLVEFFQLQTGGCERLLGPADVHGLLAHAAGGSHGGAEARGRAGADGFTPHERP